ncbi:hypothetical protein [Vreelandella olivaria]|uniref:hypothetical protein n=1 Tax=Vreelandella olivaria TaxID=390919 RepID=UPI00201F143F|nr:hypothetical protein [Halomonas olivaria]
MKKTEFEPFQWAKDGYCEAPLENPDDLLKSCGRQAEKIIEESEGNEALQEDALAIMNMVATTFLESRWADTDSGIDPDLAKSARESLVRMYILGTQATRLALITSSNDSGKEFERKLISELARKAVNARHNKPGGSRDLKEKIRSIWATGKYSSRDICAEEEWAAVGYKSFSAARKALRNTKDPS